MLVKYSTDLNRHGTDPYAWWCGRGGVARRPSIPIQRVLTLLKDNRIDYQSGQRVIDMDDVRVVFENGRELKADLVVKAVGVTPNTQWLRTTAAEWLDKRQHIRVADDLRVIGEERIYALGDCSDIREPKMLKMAKDQAIAVSNNIGKVVRNEAGEPYQRFDSRLTILPFGASNGAALLPIGKKGVVVWQPLGRFLVTKRKAARLLSNMFPGIYR